MGIMGKKRKRIDLDPIDVANEKNLEDFERSYMPDGDWKSWTRPTTKTTYSLTLQTATSLSKDFPKDFTSCFNLISLNSSADYKASKSGWKPRSKQKEMKLLDLKYTLVKNDETGEVEGFMSIMPTYENDYPVLYVYEIHLSPDLQGIGLGTIMMGYLEEIAKKINGIEKIMLTVFVRNEKGVKFYERLGFESKNFSPEPRVLRNGTVVESEYYIMHKDLER